MSLSSCANVWLLMKADPEMPPSYDGLLLLSWDLCYRGHSALPGAALPVPRAEELNLKAMLRTLGMSDRAPFSQCRLPLLDQMDAFRPVCQVYWVPSPGMSMQNACFAFL